MVRVAVGSGGALSVIVVVGVGVGVVKSAVVRVCLQRGADYCREVQTTA